MALRRFAGLLLGSRRARLHFAAVAALALIFLLAFLLFPARRIHIAADGKRAVVSSRSASEELLVEQAGVQLQPGDEVRRQEVAGDEVLAVHRATPLTLEVDGQAFSLRAQATTIQELLAEMDVALAPKDSVLRNGVFVSPSDPVPSPPGRVEGQPGTADAPAMGEAPLPTPPVQIEVQRAVPFSVVEDGQRLEFRSSRETLATALREVGVRLGPGDNVQPSLPSDVSAGLEVHVEHAKPVTVTLPGQKVVVYTLAATVGEALAEAELELPARHRISPEPSTVVTAGLAVHVIGISEEFDLEEEHIESRTVYQPDPSLPWGESRVVSGHDGVLYRRYRAVYEDGQLLSQELEAEWYDPEPRDTIVYYSTAEPPPPPTPPSPSLPSTAPPGRQAVRVLRVYATWYNAASAGRSPSDPSYGITATGVRVDRGVVAVDPSVIPLGTELYIPGYGNAVAADTGGGIRGNMVDLGYPDGVTPDWQSGWVDIYILGP